MKLLKRPLTLVLSLSVLVAAACGERERTAGEGGARNSNAKPLSVKGSDTMVILGQRFAEEYMKQNPGTVVQVTGGGSGTGIAALINGTVDLAQSSRSMKDEEKASVLKQRGSEVVEVPVALDALSVFVNSKSPVRALTMTQLAGIYMGTIRNWSEVGGPNSTIILYGRESSSGTYDYFREHVLQKKDFASAVQTLQGTAAVVNAVSKDPNGIGYGGIAYAKDVRAIAVKADDAATGIEPSEATVADGTYPLSRKLFFYYTKNSSERVRLFSAWATSPAGQMLVKEVDYFPLVTSSTPSAETATTSSQATTATGQ